MNTPTPAHVALVSEFEGAVITVMCSSLTAEIKDKWHEARNALYAALAAQQPSIEDMCSLIEAADNAVSGNLYMLDSNDCIKVLRGTWEGPLENVYPKKPAPAASPEPTIKPLDDPRLQVMFSEAIEGAIAFGAMNNNAPPAGHWLQRFWNIGRAQGMQPVEASPETCRECSGDGWVPAIYSYQYPLGVMPCPSCATPAVEVAAPVAPTSPHPEFDRGFSEGWDRATARAALSAAQPQVLSDAQIDAATMVWFGATDPHQAPGWRVHMRAAIAAAQAGGEA